MSNTTDPGFDRRPLLRAGATLAAASTLGAGVPSVARAQSSSLNPQPLPPSPEWARAMPTGPDSRSDLLSVCVTPPPIRTLPLVQEAVAVADPCPITVLSTVIDDCNGAS